ncbi:hypothetical protein KIPB_017071, partial [Kipferlia bialata]
SLTLSLHTSDMLHPIPMDIPVGMLKSLVSNFHIGPLILSASFCPPPSTSHPHPSPSPGECVLADAQFPTLSSTMIASLPGIAIDTETAIFGGCPFRV